MTTTDAKRARVARKAMRQVADALRKYRNRGDVSNHLAAELADLNLHLTAALAATDPKAK